MFKEIKLDENILKKNRVPILIKDKKWKELFKDNMTRSMRKLSERLEELIQEEKSAIREIKVLQKKKKKLMEMVLKLSDEANTNDNSYALDELKKARNKILEINKSMDDLHFKLESLPKDINKVNFELFKETIIELYTDIKDDRSRLKNLEDEIQKLRQTLGQMWEEKFSKEKRVNDSYSYLHGVLGHEETDKLDKRFL